MTPKEKAEELHVEYWHLTNDARIAKQCALIAVDKMINNNKILKGFTQNTMHNTLYLQQVKQEIEKI